jgi:hypothetical protein
MGPFVMISRFVLIANEEEAMSDPVKKSLQHVLDAMKDLTQSFEGKIEELRKKGKDEKEIQVLVNGALAMKDAAGIYIAWANHYIARLNKADGIESDEEDSMMVEE